MSKIEPTPNPKGVKRAIKHTNHLIKALNNLREEDRFHPYSLKIVLWQLGALKDFLERKKEKIAVEKLKKLWGSKS